MATSAEGADTLAKTYWAEVEATTRRLVRVAAEEGSVTVTLLARGPTLIRLERPAVLAETERVSCTYPIVGGFLVARPGGALTLEQLGTGSVELRSTLTEYSPRLVGAVYWQLQARLHSLISRRYFARLLREAR